MTAPSPPLHELLDEDFAWTRRQREVLGLIAKGYTNSQIASDLGVSLDGAKWHVREVLTKLGMHSRDEAAEYWRAYNGWPRRLRRTVAGFAAPGLLKWAGGAAVVSGIGAGVVVVAVMSPFSDDGETPAASDDATQQAQETAGPEETATPPPGEVTGLFTEPGDREPDEVRTLPDLSPGFPAPAGSGAIFDVEAGETIDLGDAWLPWFNPGGTRAAYVVGDLGAGAEGVAEIRVIELASREVMVAHELPGVATEMRRDAGPRDGSPTFWWWDDEVILAYEPGMDGWKGIDIVSSGETGLTVSFFRDDDGNGWWEVEDRASGLDERHPQALGYPRRDGAGYPHPSLSAAGVPGNHGKGYVIGSRTVDATNSTWVVRDTDTGALITEIEGYGVYPVDAETVLVFAAPYGETLEINAFTVDLGSLESEFLGTVAFPPSPVSAGEGHVAWSERACGVRDRAVPITHPDYVIAGPGDAYVYDTAEGRLIRIDASNVRLVGADGFFVTVLEGGQLAIAYDSHDVHAIVDGETMEPVVVLPVAARNWTTDRRYAATGRVEEHHGRCTGGNSALATLSHVQEAQRISGRPVVRVSGSETCLNVRDEPSTDGDILRCYVDGSAMIVRDEEGPDGWTAVRTLDGHNGWASSEYLR